MKNGCCGIVILNYNTPDDTITCVKSIMKYNSAEVKIVIVDNASTDNSPEKIKKYIQSLARNFIVLSENDKCPVLPFVSLLVLTDNKGYARGNNCGINLLKSDGCIDSILVLNSDVIFVEDIIPQMKKDLLKDNVAIVSPVLYKRGLTEYDYNCARKIPPYYFILLRMLMLGHEPKFLKRCLYLLNYKSNFHNGLLKVGLPSGSCMLFSTKTCSAINIFDPNTFLYYEENIIAEKLREVGCGEIYVNLDLKCIHLGATSTKKVPSRKIVECEANSARYYVQKVLGKNSFLFDIACQWYLFMDGVKRLLFHR